MSEFDNQQEETASYGPKFDEEEQRRPDPEILPPVDNRGYAQQQQAGYAIDGNSVPSAAMTAGQFVDQLEDGQLSADFYHAVTELGAQMVDLARASGNKQKGSVTLKIDLELEDRTFKIASDVKVTAPKVKRPRSTMWTDEHNRFTRFPPGQMQMFGVRNVSGERGPIRTA